MSWSQALILCLRNCGAGFVASLMVHAISWWLRRRRRKREAASDQDLRDALITAYDRGWHDCEAEQKVLNN